MSPEEVERERERRRAWLQRPTDEVLDELVQRTPGEPDNVYRFRRWLAERFLDWLRTNPDAALRADPRRARALWVEAVDVSEAGLRPAGRVTVWEGDVTVSKQVSAWGGVTRETDMTNLRAGALPGTQQVAAWAWAHPHGPVAALLDREGKRFISSLGELRPLVWSSPDTLLALTAREGRAELVLLTVDAQGRITRRQSLGPSPASATLASAERLPDSPWAVLVQPLRGVWAVDLAGGKVLPVHDREGELRPREAVPVAWDGRVWVLSLTNRFWLAGLRSTDSGVQVSERVQLPHNPGEDLWLGPVAAGPDGLILAREVMLRRSVGRGATAGTSSGRVSLWWLGKGRSVPEPLNLEVPYRFSERPVAVSPDGRWLAARTSHQEVRLWRLR
ncbi:hypothetical protein HRbin32_01420 [bacterium HR32]|nr:hypothetical protein HRbin32_01420 [bacterium HR32]